MGERERELVVVMDHTSGNPILGKEGKERDHVVVMNHTPGNENFYLVPLKVYR